MPRGSQNAAQRSASRSPRDDRLEPHRQRPLLGPGDEEQVLGESDSVASPRRPSEVRSRAPVGAGAPQRELELRTAAAPVASGAHGSRRRRNAVRVRRPPAVARASRSASSRAAKSRLPPGGTGSALGALAGHGRRSAAHLLDRAAMRAGCERRSRRARPRAVRGGERSAAPGASGRASSFAARERAGEQRRRSCREERGLREQRHSPLRSEWSRRSQRAPGFARGDEPDRATVPARRGWDGRCIPPVDRRSAPASTRRSRRCRRWPALVSLLRLRRRASGRRWRAAPPPTRR